MIVESPQAEDERSDSESACKSTTNKTKRQYIKKSDKKGVKKTSKINEAIEKELNARTAAELRGWYIVKPEEAIVLESRVPPQS